MADSQKDIVNKMLGHVSCLQALCAKLMGDRKNGQSKLAHGTKVLKDISWNIWHPVEMADLGNGRKLNLDTVVFPTSVTLKLMDGSRSWTIRVTDTSVRGILQGIQDSYKRYEANVGEMEDGSLFDGLTYHEAEDLWWVDAGS